jgi:DNA-binding response OmpR family regulator
MSKILIVEDDGPFADALALTFRLEGHEVLTAYNADEAIEFGLAHRPDLVIADWMLGNNMHGGEVCQSIRAACPRVKSILMTGYSDAVSEATRLCHSTEAILEKPFHKEEIIGLVNRALSSAASSEPDPSPRSQAASFPLNDDNT